MNNRKWTEEEKQHARQMRYKADEIRRLEEKIKQLESERTLFRTHATDRFKWWIKLLHDGQDPSLAWLVEHDARFLQSVSYFSWW